MAFGLLSVGHGPVLPEQLAFAAVPFSLVLLHEIDRRRRPISPIEHHKLAVGTMSRTNPTHSSRNFLSLLLLGHFDLLLRLFLGNDLLMMLLQHECANTEKIDVGLGGFPIVIGLEVLDVLPESDLNGVSRRSG